MTYYVKSFWTNPPGNKRKQIQKKSALFKTADNKLQNKTQEVQMRPFQMFLVLVEPWIRASGKNMAKGK